MTMGVDSAYFVRGSSYKNYGVPIIPVNHKHNNYFLFLHETPLVLSGRAVPAARVFAAVTLQSHAGRGKLGRLCAHGNLPFLQCKTDE